MEAKRYLQQAERLEYLIRNKQEEIVRLKEKTILPSYCIKDTSVQTSKQNDKMENAIIDCNVIEETLQTDIIEMWKKRQEIVHTIEQLANARSYDMLHKIYIQHLTLQEVANEIERSYSSVTTSHARALKELQKLLDERKLNE